MSTDFILNSLNPAQQEAVKNTEGPALILAGAGSGKTRALTHRIAYLIHQGVPPWQILAVTFTNKAANEMKDRIKALLNVTTNEEKQYWSFGSGALPVMGTFHSICAKILRREAEHLGRDRSFVIYDGDDQKKLMKGILKAMHIDEKEMKPKAALGYVGRFKCEALSPKEATAQASSGHMQQVCQIYTKYQAGLQEANAMDFDDILLETVRLFHKCPDVLNRYQDTWQYIHVDEYQDTNHVQYLLISLLSKKHGNLCVIGDPDQSIYAFRGADIRNITEFKTEYPSAVQTKLEQNYRSTQAILTAAGGVIKINPNRPEKDMWTERKGGSKILLHEVSDERTEAREAVASADAKRSEGITLNDQAILYRTNAQSRILEEACMRAGVPYRIIGGLKFYARREVKDVLAYLHVVLNPNDTIALLRIINVPSRKIGLTTLEKIQTYATNNGLTTWDSMNEVRNIHTLNEPTKHRIEEFVLLIKKYREKAKTTVVSHLALDILHATGMEKWLRDDTDEGEVRWENVQELIGVMHKYDGLKPHISITSFLEEVALISEVDKLQDAKDDALTLMTLHLCKGLEFEHVMIAGCEEGIFPHSNSIIDKSQLEEECRLMYVGMTRAKSHLQLLYARNRMLWGETQSNAPSRFLDEIPEEVVERRSDNVLSAFAWASKTGQQKAYSNIEPFRQGKKDINDVEFNQDLDFDKEVNQEELHEGTRIHHASFGAGTVIAIRGDVVEIQFDSGTRKNLALSIAPITII